VPNVIGQDGTTSATQLTALGLQVTLTEQVLPPGDALNGKVVAQSVVAGTAATPGSEIALTIGRSDTTTTLP
jgi:beta-lactam-binding protein with PASTA domain